MRIAAAAGILAVVGLTPFEAIGNDWSRLGEFSNRRTVTVHLKSGREVKGTIENVEPDSVSLVTGKSRGKGGTNEARGSVERIPKDGIQRITWRSRGLGALIGLGVGAAGGITVGANVNLFRDTGVTRAQSATFGGILFGLAGSAAGGIVGVRRSIYKAPDTATRPPG